SVRRSPSPQKLAQKEVDQRRSALSVRAPRPHRGAGRRKNQRAPTVAAGLRRRTNSRFAPRMATRITATRPARGESMAGILILIRAGMASNRLPGKPLADIAGEAMIVHVMRRAQEARLGEVWVATDSEAIAACVEKAGGRAVMTAASHASGSDRIFEALEAVDPQRRASIVLNVQGDLPTLPPSDIGAALGPLADPAVDVATLAAEIHRPQERSDPNVVKVVGTPVAARRLR